MPDDHTIADTHSMLTAAALTGLEKNEGQDS